MSCNCSGKSRKFKESISQKISSECQKKKNEEILRTPDDRLPPELIETKILLLSKKEKEKLKLARRSAQKQIRKSK